MPCNLLTECKRVYLAVILKLLAESLIHWQIKFVGLISILNANGVQMFFHLLVEKALLKERSASLMLSDHLAFDR